NGTTVSNALPFNVALVPVTLTSISPASVAPGGPSFTLTANGTGFTPAFTVTFNGSPLSTTFISSTQLIAQVPANLIANAGTASIDVAATSTTSPPPLPLDINSPKLTITSVTPGSVPAGGPSFTMLVDGTGFATGAVVYWNNTPLQTTI